MYHPRSLSSTRKSRNTKSAGYQNFPIYNKNAGAYGNLLKQFQPSSRNSNHSLISNDQTSKTFQSFSTSNNGSSDFANSFSTRTRTPAQSSHDFVLPSLTNSLAYIPKSSSVGTESEQQSSEKVSKHSHYSNLEQSRPQTQGGILKMGQHSNSRINNSASAYGLQQDRQRSKSSQYNRNFVNNYANTDLAKIWESNPAKGATNINLEKTNNNKNITNNAVSDRIDALLAESSSNSESMFYSQSATPDSKSKASISPKKPKPSRKKTIAKNKKRGKNSRSKNNKSKKKQQNDSHRSNRTYRSDSTGSRLGTPSQSSSITARSSSLVSGALIQNKRKGKMFARQQSKGGKWMGREVDFLLDMSTSSEHTSRKRKSYANFK